MATQRELINWIEKHDCICVIPHVSPDGDCLGSAVALAVALKRLGKRACVSMCDHIPEMYAFMPWKEYIFSPDSLEFEPKSLLFADVSAMDRAGDKGQLTSRITGDWALVDHHETNPAFADVSLIDADAPATGIIVYRLIKALGLQIDALLASFLYVAISTDTGNFSFSNTDSEAFIIASELMATGFDLCGINRSVFRLRTLPRVMLLGKAIDAMQFYLDGRIVVTYMDQKMFDECRATHEHAEGIINVMADVAGVEVAMTVESRDGGASTKFSLRSNTDFDVSEIAAGFNGGGHKSAAGMNLKMPVDQAGPLALSAIIKALED